MTPILSVIVGLLVCFISVGISVLTGKSKRTDWPFKVFSVGFIIISVTLIVSIGNTLFVLLQIINS